MGMEGKEKVFAESINPRVERKSFLIPFDLASCLRISANRSRDLH